MMAYQPRRFPPAPPLKNHYLEGGPEKPAPLGPTQGLCGTRYANMTCVKAKVDCVRCLKKLTQTKES